MIDFKKEIAAVIAKVTEIEEKEIESYIEVPKDTSNGDYAFPCFKLAKTLKKAPPAIAEGIKTKIDEMCSKDETASDEKRENNTNIKNRNWCKK